MAHSMWSARVVLTYALLQLPGIALLVLGMIWVQQWIEISSWLEGSIIGLWVLKDIILYPFVWRSYKGGASKEHDSMIGRYGVVQDRLDPSGRILVGGELWNASVSAEDGHAIEKDQCVRVRKIKGLTLYVEPETHGAAGARSGRPENRC